MKLKIISVILLISAITAVSVVTVTNGSLFVLAQNTPYSSNSPNSPNPTIVGPSPNPASSNTGKQANVSSSTAGGNTTAVGPAVGPPAKPIIVGPSNVNASPITNEIQGNTSTTSTTSSNGTFLGSK